MTTNRTWSVGQLAERTGLTVRALHHYEEIGLLTAQRTEAGHRRYSAEHVERLYRIRALRELGLGLGEIGSALEASTDLAAALQAHLERVEAEIADAMVLRDRLARLVVTAHEGVESDDLLTTIEGMTRMERHFSAEQLDTLAARRETLGDDGMHAAEAAWTEVGAQLREHLERGTDPASDELREVAQRAHGLIEQFTGGDPAMAESLAKLRAEWHETGESHPNMERSGWDSQLSQYMGKVLAAHR
jgi:DNA-binding transcriptional MerR regulator